jgi:predicted ATPase/class 3 adenylate cyclase
MVTQPTGTVTMLFTDIEGSTRLLERLGQERYAEALELHRRVLRGAFARHRGYEVEHEGDAFFVAFSTAEDALAAAAQAQRALAKEDWPAGQSFRVRMGIHTGEPLAVAPRYVGVDVHKAARIMASGHGGQVLLSDTTRRLVAGADVLELGEHRLKDLLQPEPLYQLRIEGMPSEFPALNTLGNRPTNLPVQPNPLIGREREVAEISALLTAEGVRLLTLSGVGGTGKTRLALQAAAELLDEFPSGVFFVPLAPISDSRLVLPTLAHVLAVREVAGESLEDALATYLETKRMLLLLDNCEQVVDAAPALSALLESSAGLRFLITSRERLRIRGERVYAVPPLRLPGRNVDLSELAANDAVALFVARGAAAAEGFALSEKNAATVVSICKRLDGLPLAIELAAAWLPALPPEALLQRLDQRLSLLIRGTRDAEERQQTLRKTIEWSYDLLTRDEQALFAGLGPFADGGRLDAVQACCDPDAAGGVDVLSGLIGLVEKNLVRQRADADGEPRFWMFETIREFAVDLLAQTGSLEPFRRRHADYYFDLVGEVYAGMLSLREEFERIENDRANIEAALVFAAEHGDFARIAAAVADLWRVWRRSAGELEVGLRWAELALAQQGLLDTDVIVRLLAAASELWRFSGNLERAKTLKVECVEIARRTGSRVRTTHGELSVIHTLADLADMATSDGNVAEARAYLEEALALGGGGRTLGSLASLALVEEDLDGARLYAQEAAVAFKAAGHDYNYAAALSMLGEIARLEGDRPGVVGYFSDALRIVVGLGDEIAAAQTLDEFALLAANEGDLGRAGCLFGAATTFGAFINQPSVLAPETIAILPADTVDAGRALTLDQAVRYALDVEHARRGALPRSAG